MSKPIQIPELALVVLIGPSGAGKSTFARRHFKPTEVLSSDACRGLVSDDDNDQSATADAFALLHQIAATRLQRGKLSVVDATNVQPEARRPLVALARQHHFLPVAIVFDVPERTCQERNRARADRDFGPHVIRHQSAQLRRTLPRLGQEGFRHVFVLSSVDEVEAATVTRVPLWNNRRSDHGPFDIVGDVHGCLQELEALLERLGYAREEQAGFRHPGGRRVVFLGDLVDRGPAIPGVLRLAMKMVAAEQALCVPGNHEMKLLKKLRGRDVKLTHGLQQTVDQLAAEPPELAAEAARFIDELVSHYVLDDGKLVVAHAGMKEAMQGRGSGAVRDFALFGETTGETDEYGLPVRYNWAGEYRGRALVVYGHTPVPEPEWLNNTLCVDTGCVFGGHLTALRYPERELVSVAAERVYCEPARPLQAPAPTSSPARTAQQASDDVLDAADVLGKRIVETRLHRTVTVREENALAALEVMSRFAVEPRWLVYLPPTMAPCDTSRLGAWLEHPAEAFGYFRDEGVTQVVCEEKHMGSRAVVVVCRDGAAARRRFDARHDDEVGVCYTRTGRRFFGDLGVERALLERVRAAVERAGLWQELSTDWLCLDAELMPWSAKAQELIVTQYAAVGAASRATLDAATSLLGGAAARGLDVTALAARTDERRGLAGRYRAAYRRYCWPVSSVDDLRLAPFHLLASEGQVHDERDHRWHLELLARLAGGVLVATPHRVVDLDDEAAVRDATSWWERLVSDGGEGMVVKPLAFTTRGRRGLVQPAIKCRGAEYLRIIYGPDYTLDAHLARLRQRGVSAKRSLALREFALGIEALERFVRKEPLRRVHEAVFGVLALESEPVDPRL